MVLKKNARFKVVYLLRELLNNTVKNLNLANMFASAPVLHFKTQKKFCPRCHTKLKVHHTDTRKIYLLDIGQCKAHRSFMYCSDCKRIFPSEDFEKQVPPYANVEYDVMVLTGRLILCKHHTINETVLEFKKHKITAKLRYRMGYEFGDNTQNIHVGKINQIVRGLEPINTHDNAAIKKLCHVLLLWPWTEKVILRSSENINTRR